VEAAISYGLLFLCLFAVVEFGMAFKDWLSVSHATREAARAGATFGDNPSSDILVLDGIEDTLLVQGLRSGDQVRVFRANNPSPSASQVYSYSLRRAILRSQSRMGHPQGGRKLLPRAVRGCDGRLRGYSGCRR
jgi:hypothetical protein